MQIEFGDFPALGIGQIRFEFKPEHNVVYDVQPREERVLLKHHHTVATGTYNGIVFDEDFARVGFVQARHQI